MSAVERIRRRQARSRRTCADVRKRDEPGAAFSGNEEAALRTPRRSPDTTLVFAFGDKMRRRAQHVAAATEDRQSLVGARQQIAHALFGAVDPELGDEGGLAERGILAGLLAERRRIAFDI